MPGKKISKNSKITTIKLRKETKDRLDHLKEYKRESYDEILGKMLYILNALRSSPEVALSIIKNIDSKMKRKSQVYQGMPQENPKEIRKEESKIEVKKPLTIKNQKQIKPEQRIGKPMNKIFSR